MFHVKHSYVGKRGFSSQIAPYPAAFPPPQHLFAPRAIPPLTQCRRRLSAAVMQAATSFSLASHAAQVHLSCKMFHVKHSYASNDNATPRSPTQATAAAPPSPAPPPLPSIPASPKPHQSSQSEHPRLSVVTTLPKDSATLAAQPSACPSPLRSERPPVYPSSQPAYPHPTNHHAQPSAPPIGLTPSHPPHIGLTPSHLSPIVPRNLSAHARANPRCLNARMPFAFETPRIGQKFSISNYLLVFCFT